MELNKLPFGTQFTPEQTNLRRLLQLAQEFDGKSNQDFASEIAKEFFSEKGAPKKLAKNTCIALKGYGLVSGRNIIRITETGKMLLSITDDEQLAKEFAKHILLNLNGLVLVETLRRMYISGDSMTKISVNSNLIYQGFALQQTSNDAQSMKQ